MKCRQSATLMITIIGGVHEDQQIALGRGLLQRGMEHGHRDATLAGPGQYADRAAAAAAQAEGHCVWGVVQPARCFDDRLLLVSGNVALGTPIEDERDGAPRHASKISYVLRGRLACHIAPSCTCLSTTVCSYANAPLNCAAQAPAAAWAFRTASKGARSKMNRLRMIFPSLTVTHSAPGALFTCAMSRRFANSLTHIGVSYWPTATACSAR